MCMVFIICERSIASFRMRPSVSPPPFCAATGSESIEKTSERATTRRFSMLCVSGRSVGLDNQRGDYRLHSDESENVQTMSAGIKLPESDTHRSLPNSRRVYVEGKLPGVRVPFREINQNPSRNFDGTLAPNPSVRVYDTSGPWGADELECDVREGLPQLRREWIVGRGDVEEYEGREPKP